MPGTTLPSARFVHADTQWFSMHTLSVCLVSIWRIPCSHGLALSFGSILLYDSRVSRILLMKTHWTVEISLSFVVPLSWLFNGPLVWEYVLYRVIVAVGLNKRVYFGPLFEWYSWFWQDVLGWYLFGSTRWRYSCWDFSHCLWYFWSIPVILFPLRFMITIYVRSGHVI